MGTIAEELNLPGEEVLATYYAGVVHDLGKIGVPAEIVRQHHERMDGSGYPQGLTGAAILIEARILAIADVVEAMASHRPYRPALGIAAALLEITEMSGTLYDAAAVAACLHLFNDKGFAFPTVAAATRIRTHSPQENAWLAGKGIG